MSDLKELNKEQSELVQRHSESLKSEVGYALALEECTDILMDFHNEMKQANDFNTRIKPALHKHFGRKRAFVEFNWWQWLLFCVGYSIFNQLLRMFF